MTKAWNLWMNSLYHFLCFHIQNLTANHNMRSKITTCSISVTKHKKSDISHRLRQVTSFVNAPPFTAGTTWMKAHISQQRDTFNGNRKCKMCEYEIRHWSREKVKNTVRSTLVIQLWNLSCVFLFSHLRISSCHKLEHEKQHGNLYHWYA